MVRAIAYKTYLDFAKKYHIKVSKKSASQLSKQIYRFEKRHLKKNQKGLYFF